MWDRAANTWRRLIDSATVAWDTGTPGQASAKLQLAGEAQGDILYRGASAWARLAAGTSGQFLQTQGGAANPQWANAGGGISTIASGSLSGATVTITSIPETFAYLALHINAASCDTDNRVPIVRVSYDNGSTFPTTNWAGQYWDGAAFNNTTAASLIPGAPAITPATQVYTAGVIIAPYQSGPYKSAEFFYANSTNNRRGRTWHIGNPADNIDALRIMWDASGNFDAGTYALYGIS